MAHIEIKVGENVVKIEETDIKFRKIMSAYMELEAVPIPGVVVKKFDSLDIQEQLNLFIQELFNDLINKAKSRKVAKLRKDNDQVIIDSIKDIEPTKKAGITK